ncbi:MAG: cupredoxin domain-containing protein [Candidatus Limnocylindrales bacterium]
MSTGGPPREIGGPGSTALDDRCGAQSYGAVHRRHCVFLLAASWLMAGVLAGCGPGGVDPQASFNGATLTIDARDLTFDPVIVTMPAGVPLRLVLDNHDAGVEHNLHVFQGATDFGTSPSVIGPGLTAIELPALAPGSYQFECTLQPDMIGTIMVVAGATPGPTPAGDSATPSDSLAPGASAAPTESAAPSDSLAPGATKGPRATRTPSAPKAPRATTR